MTGPNPYRVTNEDANKRKRRQLDSNLKAEGYGIEARPYEFDQDAFKDPNKDQWQEQLSNRLGQIDQRQAPQAQGYQGATPNVTGINQNTQMSDQSRQQQMGMLGSLSNTFQNQASGNQTSVGEMALAMQREQALKNSLAMQASARGGNVAAASRQAGRAMENANSQFMQQAAISRAAEAQQANQNLLNIGNQYGQVRGQDINVAQANQGYANQAALSNQGAQLQMIQNQNQMSQFNTNAQMQQQQMNDQMTQYFLNQGMTLDQAQMQAAMQLEQLRAQQHAQAQQTQASRYQTDRSSSSNKTGQIIGGALGAIGAVGSLFSDETVKKDVKKADKDVNEFLDKLSSYRYKYKDKKYGETKDDVYGIMAQDLEKSKVGKTLVKHNQDGVKMVDTIKGFGAVLAATKELHSRLKKLEGKPSAT